MFYSSTSFIIISSFFFFNDTATTEIYTLSLHDALPISVGDESLLQLAPIGLVEVEEHVAGGLHGDGAGALRSEEHTSELQSQSNLVCRLLLEKKKKKMISFDRLIFFDRTTSRNET